MVMIQDKLQMAFIDQNGKLHEKTFTDKQEANKAFTILSRKHLPIATKNGMESTRIWNSDNEEWFSSLTKTGMRFWQYSIGYDLLSSIWGMPDNLLSPIRNIDELDIGVCKNEDNDADRVVTGAWTFLFDEDSIIVVEESVTVNSDFPATMMQDGQKYTEWTIYNQDQRMVSFARPVLN